MGGEAAGGTSPAVGLLKRLPRIAQEPMFPSILDKVRASHGDILRRLAVSQYGDITHMTSAPLRSRRNILDKIKHTSMNPSIAHNQGVQITQ